MNGALQTRVKSRGIAVGVVALAAIGAPSSAKPGRGTAQDF